MNKKYKFILLCLFSLIVFINDGCDILTDFSLNLPLQQGITATGNNTTISNSNTVYLSDYDAYSTNVENIKSITYLAVLFRTLPRGENPFPPPDSLDLTPGLIGEKISVSVRDGDGNLVFARDLPTAAADDYLSTPYKIELTDDEITLMNKYLEGYKDPVISEMLSFTGEITISNISGGSGPPYTLTGEVQILLKLVMEP